MHIKYNDTSVIRLTDKDKITIIMTYINDGDKWIRHGAQELLC